LAAAIGVGRSAVANWEAGAKAPSTSHLQVLATTLDVSYEWLATGRGSIAVREDWIPAVAGEFIDDPIELALVFSYRSRSAKAKREILSALSIPTGRARAKAR
jgi:transcriptional regulator with XRE-family HTH domain